MSKLIIFYIVALLSFLATEGAYAVKLTQTLPQSNADKVRVELYFEALCPFCHKFINEGLVAAKGLGIMDLTLVPYGNAREIPLSGGKFNYTCQHGPAECDGNRLLGCAIDSLGSLGALPFVACMGHGGATVETDAEPCAKHVGIDYTSLMTCYRGGKGAELMHKNAQATSSLDPPHKFVPWIVINGRHTDEIQGAAQADFVGYICSLYTGEKPSGCPTPQYSLRADAEL